MEFMSSITSKIIKIHHKLLEIKFQLFPNFVTLLWDFEEQKALNYCKFRIREISQMCFSKHYKTNTIEFMSSITLKIIKIHHKVLEILVQLFPNFMTLLWDFEEQIP